MRECGPNSRGGGYLIVNQGNSGVSAARNNGLNHATGDYVWFVDSDDYIAPNCLSPILAKLYEQNLDFVKIEKQNVSSESHPIYSQPAVSVNEIPVSRTATTAFNQIIKRAYLAEHNILFDKDIKYGEDTLWVFWTHYYNHRNAYLDNRIYYYRQQDNSAMHNVDPQKHLDSMIGMMKAYKQAIENYNGQEACIPLQHLKDRRDWTIQNILFDAMRINKAIRKETLKRLQAEELYPYPFLWNRLSLSFGWKNLAVNLVALGFPIKAYYLAVGRLYDLAKK